MWCPGKMSWLNCDTQRKCLDLIVTPKEMTDWIVTSWENVWLHVTHKDNVWLCHPGNISNWIIIRKISDWVRPFFYVKLYTIFILFKTALKHRQMRNIKVYLWKPFEFLSSNHFKINLCWFWLNFEGCMNVLHLIEITSLVLFLL